MKYHRSRRLLSLAAAVLSLAVPLSSCGGEKESSLSEEEAASLIEETLREKYGTGFTLTAPERETYDEALSAMGADPVWLSTGEDSEGRSFSVRCADGVVTDDYGKYAHYEEAMELYRSALALCPEAVSSEEDISFGLTAETWTEESPLEDWLSNVTLTASLTLPDDGADYSQALAELFDALGETFPNFSLGVTHGQRTAENGTSVDNYAAFIRSQGDEPITAEEIQRKLS